MHSKLTNDSTADECCTDEWSGSSPILSTVRFPPEMTLSHRYPPHFVGRKPRHRVRSSLVSNYKKNTVVWTNDHLKLEISMGALKNPCVGATSDPQGKHVDIVVILTGEGMNVGDLGIQGSLRL